jgi:catechol 2,3-dioxygenase-like lactoylglutathione lyase family enzyme
VVPARLTLVTLGVRDLAAARAFYGRLGWEEASASQDSVAFFLLGGTVLALWPATDLAADAGVGHALPPAFAGYSLAVNVDSAEAVDAALDEAVAAGATLVKAGVATVFGRAGYFADPEGHLWEVAFNPGLTLDERGRVTAF